jgi:MFS transporter, YNFM family, putative membrane transport protein
MTTTLTLHERGTAGFRRLGLAMWCTGLATFMLVYAMQGLLPTLAAEFGVSSGTSSLALSATTLTLALAIVPLSAVATRWGPARVMTVALAASAGLGVLAPLAPTFGVLVAVRALQGIALAALPALAMSHVSREVAPRHLGGAMGLLIAGNTIGGLSGRLIATAVADVAGWRVALLVVGLVSLACTVAFRVLLPPPVAPPAPARRPNLALHLRDPGLRCLFGIGFLLMGAFVTVYNYLGFRLLAAPFGLPAALVALIFLGYLAGSYASTAAGRLGDRFGRRRVMWLGIAVAVVGIGVTVPDRLPSVLVGLVLVTVGFFAGHSLASSWVGRRSSLLESGSPAVASSLYLFGYYAGSSVGGTVGGFVFDHLAWSGVVGYVALLLLGALALAVRLRRIPTPPG